MYSFMLTGRLSTTRIVVCCVVGDGEAETGPGYQLALQQVPQPITDGAVPILHLNGYKLPTDRAGTDQYRN